MQTQTIGAPGNPAATTPKPRGVDALKSEDFFKMLVTELRQQDPFEPAKTADMIGQVSQIRGIELSSQLTNTLDLLAKQQRASGSGEMLGKYVTAVAQGADGAQNRLEGVVTGVHFDTDGSTVLELDTGEAVSASDVVSVTTLQEAQRRQAQQSAAAGGKAAQPAQATSKATDAAKTQAAARPLLSFGGISIG